MEIRLNDDGGESKGEPADPPQAIHVVPPPGELRRMPREQRQAILAAAAEMAEQDYRTDQELTGFDAFSEEEPDDDPTPLNKAPGLTSRKKKKEDKKTTNHTNDTNERKNLCFLFVLFV